MRNTLCYRGLRAICDFVTFVTTLKNEIMNIQQIKEKYTCLDYLGQPVKKTRNGYLYRAPWREDTHPSLSVTDNGRGWHDLATGEHGSVIDLVMRCLNTNDVRLACEEIEHQDPASFSFSQPVKSDGEKEKETSFTKFEVMKLQSKGLFAYLHSRKVNINIAKQFLQEAHYSFKDGDSYLYALAYANDKGGYELRSSFYKGSTSPKGITTHWLNDGAPVVVFEGFIDMLSFATMCGSVKHNYIVLNSIVNKEAALEVLKTSQNQVYLCLDNDRGGDDTTSWFLQQLPLAKDIRQSFAPAKDVNDYLLRL
jgi:5S rRNA maturation endonuclease (ribonuclease M5)